MSHHSGYPFNLDQSGNEAFGDFLKTPKFDPGLSKAINQAHVGPTGRFPDGKITENDEGEIAIGITHTPEGKVIMNFGKPTAWIGFTKEQAKNIAESLLKHAE